VVELADLPADRQARGTQNLYLKYNLMYFVYAITSLNRNYIYIGLTNDHQRRINQHQMGKEKTTAPYRPFAVIFTEQYETRIEARQREKYLKSGIGKEWIKRAYKKKL